MFLFKYISLKRRLRQIDKPCSEFGSRSKRKCKSSRTKKERKVVKRARDATRPYAVAAVKAYNEVASIEYKLVKPGFTKTVVLPTCFLHHINFTAKDANAADADQEELFFAELTTPCGVTHGAICVRFCECMGPRGSFLGDKMNGCYICCTSQLVQHPLCGGFTRGGDGLFPTDL